MPSKDEKRAAIQQHQAARRHLEQVSSKTKDVNDEYLAANRAVIAAEKNVPWYRR
ncbi:hypothetical protein [Micromonospora rubida]|uniref:hypothetical protein n=1 Tax=Micromonospora rubida TaxID=2697657 RepID=UPI00191BE50A|nr:hypothetical protein [Micromonospora rubida]